MAQVPLQAKWPRWPHGQPSPLTTTTAGWLTSLPSEPSVRYRKKNPIKILVGIFRENSYCKCIIWGNCFRKGFEMVNMMKTGRRKMHFLSFSLFLKHYTKLIKNQILNEKNTIFSHFLYNIFWHVDLARIFPPILLQAVGDENLISKYFFIFSSFST